MMTAHIAMHELKVLLRSPFAWIAGGLLQILFGWLFLSAIDRYMQSQATEAVSSSGLSSYLIVHFLAPVSIVFMFATPLLCMHLIAGDKQSNRFNLLLSLPVSAYQLVIGKFLGALFFQFLIVALTALLIILLSANINLDASHLAAAVAGLLLFISAITALTLFFSSLTKRPMLAAFLGFITVALLWIAAASSASDALQFASPSAHLHSFMQGLIDSRDIAYFAAATGILLTLGVWRFDAQRIRGLHL